jgi:YNFM family putative membrane transporter
MAFRIGARDFIPSFLSQELGGTSLEIGFLFAAFLGSAIPAPYFWGFLSDKFKRRNVVMLAMSVACVLWFFLPYGRGIFQFLLILLPLGFVDQCIGGVIQAFIADRVTKEERDLTFGVYFTVAFTIGSFSPVILGFLADFLSFQATFFHVASVSFLAVIAAYYLK